jgi:hypothetical protein
MVLKMSPGLGGQVNFGIRKRLKGPAIDTYTGIGIHGNIISELRVLMFEVLRKLPDKIRIGRYAVELLCRKVFYHIQG